MKILSAAQIRNLDQYTIQNEPISSIDLMERASMAFCKWFVSKFNASESIAIFAGTGNNGGDGLAIGRILKKEGYNIHILIIGDSEKGSEDFKYNLARLPKEIIHHVKSKEDIEVSTNQNIVIDALFGSGLNRAIEGIQALVVEKINSCEATVVSVDVPSGLLCDQMNNSDDPIIKANFTLTFQLPKLCFLLPENEKFVGEWSVVDIGLNRSFIQEEETDFQFVLRDFIQSRIKKRSRFSHKGTYGHALIIAGSYGKIGAAVLCSKSCLVTGVGLLTVQVPKCGYQIIQTSVPEAMCLTDPSEKEISTLFDINSYNSIGTGPGLGKSPLTVTFLENLLNSYKKPLVLDADALNILSENPSLLNLVPVNSILTPHPKEFERLAGKAKDSLARLALLKEFSKKYNCVTVLKGAYTATCSPIGKICFNSTGNPGMATGGSGDVLTGIITSLIAQGYSSIDAAVLGVYLHGYAADCAAKQIGYESLISSDITNHIHDFFKEFNPISYH